MRPFAMASVLAVAIASPLSPYAAEQRPKQQQPAAPPQPSQGTTAPASPEQQDAEARKKLEADIAKELGQGGTPSAPAGGGQPAGATPAPGTTGGSPIARLLLLPDISAVGSFAGAFDSYDVRSLSPRGEAPLGPKDKPTPIFQELELGLQSVIDPYARADIFISFSPEQTAVEEAYLTTLSLPGGLQVRAGKFFTPFGRINQQHPHVWEFIDAPLAGRRLLADEVLSGPGVDVAWLAPLPWFAELHLAGQGIAPTEEDQERLTGTARLLQYFPIAQNTTLGLGLSAARRDEASNGGFRDLGAVDAYLRWRPLQSRSYVALQGELYARKLRNVEDAGGTEGGGYAQVFWRTGPYYGFGVRYDNAPIGARFGAAEEAAAGREHRYGAIAAWLPSEFQRIRLQASYDRRPDGRDGLEALLSVEIGIGSHGAHPF